MRSIFTPFAAWVLVAGSALAQVSPEEHAKHHPQGTGEPGAASMPPAPAGPGGQASGKAMQQMMREMHAPPGKELYPTLIALPKMTPEQASIVERAADERLRFGASQMSSAMDRLLKASGSKDYRGMQDAVGAMREGLGRFDSGLAAHRALHEGQSPQTIATDWFKDQLNLQPLPSQEPQGPLGLSWSHWTGMSLIAAFTLLMLVQYFWRMRRTGRVLARLAAAAGPASKPLPIQTAARAVTAPQPKMQDSIGSQAPENTAVWRGELVVAGVFQETPEIKTFRLVPPSGGPMPFRHKPGQYVCVFVQPADASTVRRCYSIASSPSHADYIELTVKREDKGIVSKFLHSRVQVGDRLRVEGPKGYFTFTGNEADSIVLITGGVGITPAMSVIRALTDRGWSGDIFLLHCARTTQEFVFRDELEFLQRRHRNLHVVAALTRSEGTTWMGPRGRLTAELIRECVPAIERRRIHLCGPPAMMDFVKGVLESLHVPKEQIRTEAFGPAPKPIALPLSPPALPSSEIPAPLTGTVTFARSGKSGELPPNKTVLDVADELGVTIESACRSGTCGSCKIRLLKGTVTMAVEDALEADEKRRGIVLACQAKSTGAVEVDA